MVSFLSFLSRRWRRTPAPTAPPRPDLIRTALLEHELLGIEPEPGTPAAHAVALAKPVDVETCPHEDAIETTELGNARPQGMCTRCGTALVADDDGGWEAP